MSHSADYYTELYSTGSGTSTNLRVYLYANRSSEYDLVGPDGPIAGAVKNGLHRVYEHGGVDGYRVVRFDANKSSYNFFDHDSNGYENNFDDYLKNEPDEYDDFNGNGATNLRNYRGVHLLVHGHSGTRCSIENAGAEGHDSGGSTAFNTSVAAWTPIGCSSYKLERASAIQETLHCYINYDLPGVYDLVNATTDSEKSDHLREHALGKVKDRDAYNVTPLLAYHEYNDSSGESRHYRRVGECQGTGRTPYRFTTGLTDCTKEAVKLTADDSRDY